jgi:hypothetical protein
MLDPLLSLAFSIHSHKGVYAVLLGSGVSRSAGIPTGWDIVQDLSRQLALMQSEEPGEDDASWYTRKYGKEPGYSDLLAGLGVTPAERRSLLGRYFEPTAVEREQGLKTPTKAHRAVARLVAQGYIRVILTTNFDRLIERALADEGIEPLVVATADAVSGATPLVHARAVVVKLHGDYLDDRILNTEVELHSYDARLNSYLDRVLDEFGLVICGWSGEWDSALRAAFERCPSRRYNTFWATRTIPAGRAQDLISLRGATIITIRDADSFFITVAEKVSSLEDSALVHPLATKIATATLKRYLAEPKHCIRAHDLVLEEANVLAA